MTKASLAGFTLALGFALAACNPVQRIATSTNAIRSEARVLVKHGHEINDRYVVDKASNIDDLASGIHEDLSNVTNKDPAWLSALQWWGIAVAVAGICFLLWQSGAFTAIRIAVGWLPRRKRQEADFIEAVLDPNKPESTREYIAARRAADPELNAALAAKEHK